MKGHLKVTKAISTILIILTFIFMFVACSSNSSPLGNNKSDEYIIDENNGGIADDADDEGDDYQDNLNKGESSALTGRKLIRNANINIESLEYEKSKSALSNLVKEFEGYVQDSQIQDNVSYRGTTNRRSEYTIRIPSENFDAFIEKTGTIGNVLSKNIKGDDVSDQYFDKEARINSLKIQEESLNALLKDAKNLSDILELEKRLSEIRYEIEQLTGTLKKWDALVELSTIKVTITEVEEISEPEPEDFGEKLKATLKGSFNALVATLKFIIVVLTAILPFLIPVAIVFVIVVAIMKIRSKNKNNTKKS